MLKPKITVCEGLSIGDANGRNGQPLTTIVLLRGRRRFVHAIGEPETLEELAGVLLRQAELMRDPLRLADDRARHQGPRVRGKVQR